MTIKQAEARIKEEYCSVEEFHKWMFGQTVGMDENGDVDIYEYDVERFIKYCKRGRGESLFEFD